MKNADSFGQIRIRRLDKIAKSPLFAIVMILLIMFLLLAFTTKRFFTSENMLSVIRAFSTIAIIAIGECMVIITKGIDLSVGSIFAFCGFLSALFMAKWGIADLPAILMGMFCAFILGLVNGLVITKLRIAPFIATLGTMSIVRGLTYNINGGFPIANLSSTFRFIGQGYIGNIPFPVFILIFIGIFFSLFLRNTIIGRRIFAVGGNEQVAHYSGINTDAVKVWVYCISAVLAGISGMIHTARLGVAQSTAGIGYELDTIAAVIIGGASFSGGVGTVIGSILGAAIMGVLINGLVLMNVSSYWQQTIIGCVIIIAAALDQKRTFKTEQRKGV